MLHALLVDDDAGFTPAAAELIRQEGFEVDIASSLSEAHERLRSRRPHLVLVDLVLPDGSGLDLVRDMAQSPATKIVLITGHASVASAIEALRTRALDYLTKPLDLEHLRRLLMLVRLQQTHRDIIPLIGRNGGSASFGPLVGASDTMREMYTLIEKVAPTEATVLLCGESGTGKDLAGRAIHELSARRHRPYLALNCGALAPTLVGSELFGHERGSFTGANRQHKGYFERASGGTLFLDEITEMAPDLQVHLLRVLETKKLVRLGGDKEINVDVRVIAATNRRPEERIAAGKFRKDLFFRLSGFPINVPPLRDRKGDVEVLARYFLGLLNREYSTHKRLSEAALRRLTEYDWPGNVRELRNAIERSYVMTTGGEILEESLRDLRDGWGYNDDDSSSFAVGDSLDDVERKLISATLQYFNGNKRKTAQSLGISLKTIYNRLVRYNDENRQ